MVNGKHIRLHKHGADERLAEIEKRLRQLTGSGARLLAAPGSPMAQGHGGPARKWGLANADGLGEASAR
jgi:hypothetical protein